MWSLCCLVRETNGREEPDDTMSGAEAAVLRHDALIEAGLSMAVVGGSAVTAYDPDAYTSLDINLGGPGLAASLDEVLRRDPARHSNRGEPKRSHWRCLVSTIWL